MASGDPGRQAPILIVDDNADTRSALTRVLHLRGYATATATTGTEALRHLRAGRPVRAVILDLMLPDVSGRAVLAAMRADPRLRAIPVVVFSALDEAPLDGLVAYVRKGVEVDRLLEAVDDACATAPRRPGKPDA